MEGPVHIRDRMIIDEFVYRFEAPDFHASILVLKGLDDMRARDFDREICPKFVSVQALTYQTLQKH